MANQLVHVIQIQHDTGPARAAPCQKKGARVLEPERNKIPHHLQNDLRAHEGEHVVRRGSGAAPTVARAIRDEPEETKDILVTKMSSFPPFPASPRDIENFKNPPEFNSIFCRLLEIATRHCSPLLEITAGCTFAGEIRGWKGFAKMDNTYT